MIQTGYITEILEDGIKAKVRTLGGEVLNNVVLIHAYGETSDMEVDQSSMVLLFFALGSKSNAFGIPYNPPLQPVLEKSEKAVGNFKKGNKITFKKNGSIEIKATDSNLINLISTLVSNTGDINTGGSYKVQDIQVVTQQQPTIPDPTGGGVIDAQARATIVLILTALKTHGLIA